MLSLVLENWLRPMVKSYRHTNLFEPHFKNTLSLDVPWVVGSWSLVHEQSLHYTLKFLDITHKQWPSIALDSVHAFIEALAAAV